MSLKNDPVMLCISVQPRSSKTAIVLKNGCIKVYLKSPPVDGKANEECIALFSKILHLPKSCSSIDKGEHGKHKKLKIKGLPFESVMKIISEGAR
jgi:hypothetical protein